MKFWIGTSGWTYKHWKGEFYPKEIKQSEWLSYYSQYLKSVEINNSFYALPREKVLQKWKNNTSDDFLFSIKVWRGITHLRRLINCAHYVKLFLKLTDTLRPKLGPVLFQLPPNFKKDVKRLRLFLKLLPKHQRFVFEFRHPSWFSDEVYDLLHAHNIALCLFEFVGIVSPPRVVTADFIYVRLHGRESKYIGNYSHEELKEWRNWLLAQDRDFYVYFDNTDKEIYAIQNAIELGEMVK